MTANERTKMELEDAASWAFGFIVGAVCILALAFVIVCWVVAFRAAP